MIASLIARFHGAAAYRKVVALLLVGCVAGFVLGQVAGHQPRASGSAAAVTSPAHAISVISGALGTPLAPPHVIVPLNTPRTHQGDDDGHDVPPAIPLPRHSHHKGGAPMPPIPPLPLPLIPPTQDG